ncbi:MULTISPECIES: Lrp/AsnC family transcriptional regulator [unclassified Corallococcus]|uniref:Lrp/AsnC family transcriptional regulator n=1 Tax=unclassified Corallococcus TaxID=2685029 RepID=UPI001A8DB968|nr:MULTISPECIES: Lrp/AsnC family transcriptional regulator [unclassified Corallococcus]MBN9681694.1 Lrp/AsnC family transcriptional regulator [Corallococcus sp. NCSPR001]WAS86735.1 Lrp/AsnC family transcriptional regulator [Corallococcus sp. NCRR]
MDALDYRIVDMLQRDGRATQLELSRGVKLSQPAVAERIRKLEEKGVITGYTARVDATQLGKDITAFIGVSIEHPKHFEGFARKVAELSDVLEAHRVAGQDSYVLKVKTANTRTLDSLLVETLRTIPGVTRTSTTIVLSTLKEDTHVRVPDELLNGE